MLSEQPIPDVDVLPFPVAAQRARYLFGERVLGELPGPTASSRTVLLLRSSPCGQESFRIRNETNEPNVGWVPQTCVDIDAAQAKVLTAVLSSAARELQARPAHQNAAYDGGPMVVPFAG